MAFDYDPKAASNAWPEGEYDAVLQRVETGVISRSSGNEMEVWHIEVYGPEGKSRVMKDYVTAKSAAFKYKSLASAVGQRPLFESGGFDPVQYEGESLRVLLSVEDNEQYGQQNRIKRFVSPGASATPTPTPIPSIKPMSQRPALQKSRVPLPVSDGPGFTGDDIPF